VNHKTLAEGTTISALLASINGWSASSTKVLVNGAEVAKTSVLKDGDEVVLIPTNPKLALHTALYQVDTWLRLHCEPR
jgi:molybdopterin converting factor small subunit